MNTDNKLFEPQATLHAARTLKQMAMSAELHEEDENLAVQPKYPHYDGALRQLWSDNRKAPACIGIGEVGGYWIGLD